MLLSAAMKSSRHWARRCSLRAAASFSSDTPAFFARTMASMRSTMAAPPRSRSSWLRDWMTSTRAFISSSEARWQAWQARAFAPREGERHLRRAVVLDVALAAHEAAQLVARGVEVGIVGTFALARA